MDKLFDSHAHYFDTKFNDLEGGADSLLSSAEFQELVGGVVNVGTTYESSLLCIEQAKKYDFMYAAVGIHPEDAQTKCKLTPDEELARIKALVCDENRRKESKIVAIGEIGFDYYWQPVDKELQREYFEKQMALAAEFELPVIIHDREAHGDTFELLCKYPSVRGVLHSCSMSAEMVREVVKRGWFVSFSGTVTFKNASRVREACAAVPLDRILIETDAPYLAPVPHRGKMNNSMYMQNTAKAIADVFSLPYDEVVRRTCENARELFGI